MVRRQGTDPLCVVIGANIRRLREELEISQNGLAAAVSARGTSLWTAATVSALEAGRRNVSLSELADLIDVLDLSLDKVLAPPDGVDRGTKYRSKTLSRGRSNREGLERFDESPAGAGEVELALRAARQRRLEDNIWRSLAGRHPTPSDRVILEKASSRLFGRSLLDERDLRAAINPSGARLRTAVLGHATRSIINDLKDYINEKGQI